MPLIPTVALMGHGIEELFTTAIKVVHDESCPLPQRRRTQLIAWFTVIMLSVAIPAPAGTESLLQVGYYGPPDAAPVFCASASFTFRVKP